MKAMHTSLSTGQYKSTSDAIKQISLDMEKNNFKDQSEIDKELNEVIQNPLKLEQKLFDNNKDGKKISKMGFMYNLINCLPVKNDKGISKNNSKRTIDTYLNELLQLAEKLESKPTELESKPTDETTQFININRISSDIKIIMDNLNNVVYIDDIIYAFDSPLQTRDATPDISSLKQQLLDANITEDKRKYAIRSVIQAVYNQTTSEFDIILKTFYEGFAINSTIIGMYNYTNSHMPGTSPMETVAEHQNNACANFNTDLSVGLLQCEKNLNDNTPYSKRFQCIGDCNTSVLLKRYTDIYREFPPLNKEKDNLLVLLMVGDKMNKLPGTFEVMDNAQPLMDIFKDDVTVKTNSGGANRHSELAEFMNTPIQIRIGGRKHYTTYAHVSSARLHHLLADDDYLLIDYANKTIKTRVKNAKQGDLMKFCI